MKVIDSYTDGAEIQKIYHELMHENIELCLWQKTKDYMHDRLQYRFNLESVSYESQVMNFLQVHHRKIDFKAGKIFCYCESRALIFTATIMAVGTYKISIEFPAYIYLLDESESALVVENKWGELQDLFKEFKRPMPVQSKRNKLVTEEERYKHVRETPRGKPSEVKRVTLRKLIPTGKLEREYDLFDLSQGGLALLTKDPFFLEKGTQVELVRIDNEYFSPELMGEVMSVNLTGQGTSQYKIGIKFLEELK